MPAFLPLAPIVPRPSPAAPTCPWRPFSPAARPPRAALHLVVTHAADGAALASALVGAFVGLIGEANGAPAREAVAEGRARRARLARGSGHGSERRWEDVEGVRVLEGGGDRVAERGVGGGRRERARGRDPAFDFFDRRLGAKDVPAADEFVDEEEED